MMTTALKEITEGARDSEHISSAVAENDRFDREEEERERMHRSAR